MSLALPAPEAPLTTNLTPPESGAFSWDAFLSTYLPALVLSLGTGIALPAIPVLARSFNVSFGLASGVVTAFVMGGMVGSLPTGWLIDRFGRRRIMLAGPLLTSVMAVMVMTAHSFPELIAYRFLDGWAAQMWLMGRLTGIADRARANQRGRQVTWMYGMDSLGRLSGPLVGGFIAASWGLRAPFGAYALLALLALIPGYKFIKESSSRTQTIAKVPGEARSMTMRQLVLPRLAFFGVALFSAMARGPIYAGMLHLYAAFAYDLDPRQIGILATSASLLTLPISFSSGILMDRYGRKRTMVPGFSGVTVTMLLLAVTAFLHLSLAWYVGVFLSAVLCQGLTGGSVQTVGTDLAPKDARGMFLGVWRFAGQVGTAASPILFALLADKAGYGFSFVFSAAVAFVVAWLLITQVPETSQRSA